MAPASNHPDEFPVTHWTLIAAASGPESELALGRVYKTYWHPLCAQARRFGVPEDDVEDVVQDLFLSLFRSGAVGRADSLRGRFRSYLLGALRNFLSHRRDRDHAQKRGGAQTPVPLDELDAASIPASAPLDARQFDAGWAHALLGEAMRRFDREIQHSEESRASFAVLGNFALGDAELSSEDAAHRLGITVPAVKSRVFRLRLRFHQIVREEVLRTVSSEGECDDELRYLGAVLEKVNGVPAFPTTA